MPMVPERLMTLNLKSTWAQEAIAFWRIQFVNKRLPIQNAEVANKRFTDTRCDSPSRCNVKTRRITFCDPVLPGEGFRLQLRWETWFSFAPVSRCLKNM